MFKSFKFRIYPDENQTLLIDRTINCTRFIYNKMLEDKIACYEKDKTTLFVTPAQYKAKYDFLNEVDSLALANAQLNLDMAYNLFFKNPKYGYPQFKSKKDSRKSYTTNLVNNNIRLEAGRIKLPKIGRVRIKQHRHISEIYTLKSCTVSKTSTGKYFVALRCSYEPIIREQPINTVIGLKFFDSGLETSDNVIFEYPLGVFQTLNKYKRQNGILSKMQYGSNNYYKQKRKTLKIRERLSNQCMDYLHKTTKQIANAYDCASIEDITSKYTDNPKIENKKNRTEYPDFAINFTELLQYKLEEIGKRLVVINNDRLLDCYTAEGLKKAALKAILT